jgi:hypothetical protein
MHESAIPDSDSDIGETVKEIHISVQRQTAKRDLDPLLYDFDMPLQATYYPLGFSLEITTNSSEVLAAAEESWGHFGKIFSEPPLQIRIGVLDGGPAECPPVRVLRQQRSLVAHVADADNFSVSDMNQGFAFAWLTRVAVENRPYLRWHFIEGVSWDLLARYLTPVHAACVRFEDHGFLLCGDSGAGKSSLAFACALKGWTYVADDGCCIVRGRKSRVAVGNPYQIRFRESAVELFPQLKNQRLTRRLTGDEMTLEVPTASLPQMRITAQSPIDSIIFLNRGDASPARLLHFPKDKALLWFEQIIFPGEKDTVQAHKASLRQLLEAEVLELRYTHLDSAIEQLEALVCDGRRLPSGVCTDVESREHD